MSQINPFGGYVAGSTQALRVQSAEKDRQVHRLRRQARNSTADEDEDIAQVDNPQALTPIQDRDPPPDRRKRQSPDQDHPHLDVTG